MMHLKAVGIFLLGTFPGFLSAETSPREDAKSARLRHDHLAEAAAYDRWLDQEPDNREAWRGRVLALADLGASHLAIEQASDHPGWFTEVEWSRLLLDGAAADIRWAEIDPVNEDAAYGDAEKALRALDRALPAQSWEALDTSENAGWRAASDRILALKRAGKYQEALAWSRQLQKGAWKAPAYALQATAQAASVLGRENEALANLKEASKLEPEDPALETDYAWALLETGRHRRAGEEIAQLTEHLPIWTGPSQPGEWLITGPQVEAKLLEAARLRASGNAAAARRDLQTLIDQAPANADLRSGLADLYLARGWPRRAWKEYARADALEPGLSAAQIGQAEVLVELGARSEARRRLEALEAAHPNDGAVASVLRELRQNQAAQVETNWMATQSSGGEVAENSQQSRTRISFPETGERVNHRIYLEQFWQMASFEEGMAEDWRSMAGINVTGKGWETFLEAQGIYGDSPGPGARAGLAWQMSDFWQTSALVEWNSSQMPLRGRPGGLEANYAELGATYAWNESGHIAASTWWLDVSDSNRMLGLSLDAEQRLLSVAGINFLGGLGWHGSRGRELETLYFNPIRDCSSEATLAAEVDLAQFGTHQLELQLGDYWQREFGADSFYGVKWSVELDLGPKVAAGASAFWRSHPFDGQRETEKGIQAGCIVRF